MSIPLKFYERYKNILFDKMSFVDANSFIDNLSNNTVLRLNRTKISPENFIRIAKENNWKIHSLEFSDDAFYISPNSRITKSLEFALGLFYIQEASSQIPPIVLNPTSDDIVLDMTAAPGSKTTQMALMMKNKGVIIANDKNPKRLKSLSFNIEKYGITNTGMLSLDAKELGNRFTEFFTKVLLDAPCSAEGAIKKDPEYFDYWSEKRIYDLSKLQQTLMISAYKALKNKGTLVYSTCTIAPEENENNVEFLLSKYKDCIRSQEASREHLPAFTPVLTEISQEYKNEVSKSLRIGFNNTFDPFFVSKFYKTCTHIQDNSKSGRQDTSKFRLISKRKRDAIIQAIFFQFGIPKETFDLYDLYEKKDKLILVSSSLSPFIHYSEKAGYSIGKFIHDVFKPSFLFGYHFAHTATKQVLSINREQARDYFEGRSGIITDTKGFDSGHVLLTYSGFPVGKGIIENGKVRLQIKKEYISQNLY